MSDLSNQQGLNIYSCIEAVFVDVKVGELNI